ncbi:MAG: fluoride efflux transporter CrcB [Desulfovibrionaceae bacterium]|nr:fluoride efflux transporter CrcB [Desulfovibrionaceae bacterium]
MVTSVLAIALGASLGAILRWLAGMALNAVYPAIPLGTLAVNLVGGFCMGLALRVFEALPELSPEWRLFVCTGFLGALTTFSTFSAEMAALLQQQKYLAALGGVLFHVVGALLAFFLGMWAHQAWYTPSR